jgi:hypothetical protein
MCGCRINERVLRGPARVSRRDDGPWFGLVFEKLINPGDRMYIYVACHLASPRRF